MMIGAWPNIANPTVDCCDKKDCIKTTDMPCCEDSRIYKHEFKTIGGEVVTIRSTKPYINCDYCKQFHATFEGATYVRSE